jgi:regulation of enolase protein 1 (concanavalin A-like superfamily)
MSVAAMLAVVLVSFQAPDADTTPWQTVVSKEGQFIIDFPTAPTSNSSKNENGPGGRMKVVEIECETPSAVYIAQKITLPTAVVKGAEQNSLKAFRDRIVQIYKGKIVSEKPVRYEASRPGLDFTLRAQPQAGMILTLRIREYLAGQSIYILIAGSAPNRELPEDTGRFFGSFTIGTVKRKKSGPKAEVEGKEIAGWGSAIDPDGDCKIAVDGKALVVEVPAKLHDLNADIDKFNAPRVLREVEGDFNIQVKVVGEFKPGAKSLNPKSLPFNGAGIFVWRDSDNYIRLERAGVVRQGKLNTFAVFEEREGGSRSAQNNGPLTPGTAYLRMERRGSRIAGFVSKDGKHWTALRPIDTVWPAELKIGFNAINSSDAPFTVRFEEFTIKTRNASKP